MSQTELPLYPKVSSIYNKIMQLAIAIFIIIVVMNLWFYSYGENRRALEKDFRYISQQYLSQLAIAADILLAKNDDALQGYVDDIAQQSWIKDVSLYDETGQIVVASKNQSNINDLYGFSQYKADKSAQYTPFVKELRIDGKLKGYLRLTVENGGLTQHIDQASEQHYNLLRLMMILAGVVGFLLTRGLNRFSRQGFRLAKSK